MGGRPRMQGREDDSLEGVSLQVRESLLDGLDQLADAASTRLGHIGARGHRSAVHTPGTPVRVARKALYRPRLLKLLRFWRLTI